MKAIEDLEGYFYNAIKESIFTCEGLEIIVNFYGSKDECSIENYFVAQTNSGMLYDSIEEFSEETLIGEISDLEYEFNVARVKAYEEWLVDLCENVDENSLIDVSDETETDSESIIYLHGDQPDMQDQEFATLGDSLFEKIYSHMGETSFGQNVRVAAILAGAKYVYIDSEESNYSLYFWRNNKSVDLLEKFIVVKMNDENESIRMTLRQNFSVENRCDNYSNYGNKVGCYDAGCYSFDNSDSPIFEEFESAIKEKFSCIFEIMQQNNLDIKDLVEMFESEDNSENLPNFEKMVQFYEKWKAENESHTEVTSWTYHDSHNFKSIVLKCDFGEPDCEELDDEDQVKILLQYPGFPHIDGTNATEETEDYLFEFDLWATNPWICEIEIK